MIKRIRQFYINLIDKMYPQDYDYVKSKLNEREYNLFEKLSKSEQKHCVRVAREIEHLFEVKDIKEDLIRDNKEILIKASLLHDVGKTKSRINIIEKSIIVILSKITKQRLKNLKNDKVQCYYNHAEYSYELLKNISSNEILDIVRYHHSNNVTDPLLLFFQQIDDNN